MRTVCFCRSCSKASRLNFPSSCKFPNTSSKHNNHNSLVNFSRPKALLFNTSRCPPPSKSLDIPNLRCRCRFIHTHTTTRHRTIFMTITRPSTNWQACRPLHSQPTASKHPISIKIQMARGSSCSHISSSYTRSSSNSRRSMGKASCLPARALTWGASGTCSRTTRVRRTSTDCGHICQVRSNCTTAESASRSPRST